MESVSNVEGLPPSPARIPALAVSGLTRFAFLSGRIAQEDDGSVMQGGTAYEQSKRILRDAATALEAVGSGLDRVVKIGVFITERMHFAGVVEAYNETWTDDTRLPARTTLVAELVPEGSIVEWDFIAEVPDSAQLPDFPAQRPVAE